jgi:hypothetical protein
MSAEMIAYTRNALTLHRFGRRTRRHAQRWCESKVTISYGAEIRRVCCASFVAQNPQTSVFRRHFKPEVRCVCVQVLCKNEPVFARPSDVQQILRPLAIYPGKFGSI